MSKGNYHSYPGLFSSTWVTYAVRNGVSQDQAKKVTLNYVLYGPIATKYKSTIELIREINKTDPDKAKTMKTKYLPIYMPTGIYGAHRDADHLAEFSRLMQIDIDHQDNPGLTTDDMKAIVCACKGVAYCGLSARGEGVFALIRVPDDAANPDRYKGYYRAFVEQLKAQGVATDDSANTIAKPRYISWDDQPFINEDAEPFASWMPQGSCTQAPRCSNVYATDSDKTFTRAEEIVRQAEQQGNPIATTWQAWRYLAMSLARAFGERGRGLFLRLCDVWSSTTGKHQKQNPDKVFSQANENNPIRNEGYFFTMAKDAGITLK